MSGQEFAAVDRLASSAVARYELPVDVIVERFHVSQNTTYRVVDPSAGRRYALRVYQFGYQSLAAIESELAWMEAVRDAGVAETARVIRALDGSRVVTVEGEGEKIARNAVLFDWLEGTPPDSEDMTSFCRLGAIAARLHEQVRSWQRPPGFTRVEWDCDQYIGSNGRAGRWQDNPSLRREELALLSRLEATIRDRLAAYGAAADRYGLVHGDLHVANLLIDGNRTSVLDFDECGDSWYLSDWAGAVTFIEDHPNLPAMQDAWVEGYRSIAALSAEDEAELPTFLMMSRLFYTAWIMNHDGWASDDATTAHTSATSRKAEFTAATCELAERYLASMS